jgi:beta-1,4-mannosyltransferase
MILTSKVLGMAAGTVRIPAAKAIPSSPIAELHFAPYMYGNPYQDLLYSAFGESDISVYGHRSIAGAIKAIETSTAANKILHLHWLNVILAEAADSEIPNRISEFKSQLQRAKAAGAKIVWTVHNVLPHEGYQMEPSIEVRKTIVAAADVVHVMSPETVVRCKTYFDIPAEKVIRIEHAGYHGFYPELSKDISPKKMWGLPERANVLVSLGGIKPYKGLGDFAAVFQKHASSDTHFLIAGKAAADFNKSELARAAEFSTNLHVFPEMVADSQVTSLMQMADAVVIPYQASLNSGALALGLTYGKPILARATAGSTHLLKTGAGKIYQDESDLPKYLSSLDWLKSATTEAAIVSAQIDQTKRSQETANIFRVFALEGTAAAQKKASSYE